MFTAVWEVIEYTITYGNGVEETSVSQDVAYPSELITKYTVEDEVELPQPIRDGYTFEGWVGTNFSVATKHVIIPESSIENRTFTATWKVIEYEIVFNNLTFTDSKSGPAVNMNPTKYTIEDEITLSNAGRMGYTFTKWAEGNKIEKGSTGTKTFTPNWQVINYSITYVLNGGTNATSNPTTYTIEDAVTLANPSKTGYDFSSWKEGNSITAGSMGNKTFTATWSVIEYSITYVLNGGTNATSNPKIYTIEDAVTLANPSKTGYTFDGWTQGNSIAVGTTGNKTFTATWTPIEYSITYELDGGTNASANPATYTIETATFTLDNPTKTDHNFLGWYSDTSLTTIADITIEKGSTGALTFYAGWEEAAPKEIVYTNNGDGTVTITKIDDIAGSDVKIPSTIDGLTVTTIAANVIAENSTVKTITIPATVTTIEDFAFSGGLQKVSGTYESKLGSTYTDYHVEKTDDNLTTPVGKFIVESGNTNFATDDNGVLYKLNSSKQFSTLVQFPIGSSLTQYDIPKGVVYVGAGAFAGSSLENIKFEYVEKKADNSWVDNSTLKEIGVGAFYNCTNIEYIFIPITLTDIYGSAFEGCSSLYNIQYSEDAITDASVSNKSLFIYTRAFHSCNLKDLKFVKRIISVKYRAFTNNSSSLQISFYGESVHTALEPGWNLKYEGNEYNTYTTKNL